MSVRELPSARLRDARANLAAFVQKARESAAFGRELDFDGSAWDVSDWHRARPSAQSKKLILYFTTHENGDAKGMLGRRPMLRPFGDFIKAVVRLRHENNPRQAAILGVLIRASRYLHDTCVGRAGDPCSLKTEDFEKAAQACRFREKESSQYRVGLWLEEIARSLNKYAISKGRIDFSNPFPRVTFDHTRIGKEHDARRASKLPSPAAYDALGKISNLVVEPSEVVRMRAVEILVATGFRINECLSLPEDCEVEEEIAQDRKSPLSTGLKSSVRYGLRYWPEKGGRPDVKWIITPMVDVVKRAIRDIKKYRQNSQDTAKWLETHPGRACFDVDNDQGKWQIYCSRDIEIIFGLNRGSGVTWAKSRDLRPADVKGGRYFYSRADIEAALLASQKPLALSLATVMSAYLFLVPENFCSSQKPTNPSVVCFLTDQQIGDFLSGRISKRGVTRSFFDRFGFTEADGSPIELTSHMFRHWLNTLLEQGGLGQHEIARWFGRTDVGQNATYDHVSGMQKAEEVHRLMESGGMRGPMAETHQALPPVLRSEFRDIVVVTGHTTDLGVCISDWSLLPCADHGSCGRCWELLICKGNQKHKSAAEKLLSEHEWLLTRAEGEADEETYGASNYVAHHRSMVEGLRQILAVHNNSDISDGTLVQLKTGMPARLINRALEEL